MFRLCATAAASAALSSLDSVASREILPDSIAPEETITVKTGILYSTFNRVMLEVEFKLEGCNHQLKLYVRSPGVEFFLR